MKKFESVLDLLKAGGLHGHFKVAAAHHAAKAAAHDAVAKTHSDYAATVKAKHDGMDDGDVNKGFMKAHADMHLGKAAFHTTQAGLHKAMADHAQTMADNTDDGEKAAAAGQKCTHDVEMTKACDKCNRKAAEPATTMSLENLFSGALKADFDEFRKSDEFKSMIRDYMKREAAKALGLELEPSKVVGAIPSNPHIKLVARPGGFDPEEQEDKDVDPVAAEVIGG